MKNNFLRFSFFKLNIPPFQYSIDRYPNLQFKRQERTERMGSLTRRFFLRWLLGFPFLFLFPFRVRETIADLSAPSRNRGEATIAEFFKGEELVCEIGFWLFKRVALGKLSFSEMEEKGHYMATLQAETLGVVGWLTRYRIDTYRSTMEEIDEGRRLRSISFEEDVKIGSKLRKRIH